MLDTSFANNGVYHYTSIDPEYYITHSLFLFQDGILITGEDYFQGQAGIVLNKLTESGEVDMSFGNNGIITSFFNNGGYVRAFYIDEFDNIFAFGREMGRDWRLAKYDSNGVPVQGFGNHSNGFSVITFDNSVENNTTPYKIIVRDNKVFLSGEIRQVMTMPATTFTHTQLINMNASTGLFDSSFGNNGRVAYGGEFISPPFVYYYAGRSFILDDAGRLIIGGVSKGPDATKVRKLNQNGSIGLEEVYFQYLAINNSYSFQFGNKILAAGADFANNQLIITRHFDGVLSVNENQMNNSVSIYPNPANDFFRINSERNIDSVKIYNLLGVLHFEYEKSELYSILGLPSGIYLVTIEYHGRKETKKLVVQ